MKIGFDAKRAFVNRAGLGNYSRNTLIALKKYYPRNDYLLFTPEIRDGIFPEQNNFNVISPDSPASKLFKSFWRTYSLSGMLEKHEIDLFHGLSHELPSGIHKTGVKSLVTIHDLIFLRYPQYYKSIDRKIYLEKIKYSTKVADKIIAISSQTRNDIVEFLDVDPQKIEIVFQGVAERFFSENKLDFLKLKTKYNLPGEYILSVGTIELRKNQLNVLKGILNAKLEIPLVLIGKPTQYALKISEFVSENNLEGKVILLYEVEDDELPALYNNACLLAYMSAYEGFGLPVIEAMASGCPVLTSNTSCMPETGADAALYAAPGNVEEIGNSIKRILENSDFRKNMIENGKKRAQDFKPEKTSEQLMEIYKIVAANEY